MNLCGSWRTPHAKGLSKCPNVIFFFFKKNLLVQTLWRLLSGRWQALLLCVKFLDSLYNAFSKSDGAALVSCWLLLTSYHHLSCKKKWDWVSVLIPIIFGCFCFYSSAISPTEDPEVSIHNVAFQIKSQLFEHTQLEITHHWLSTSNLISAMN